MCADVVVNVIGARDVMGISEHCGKIADVIALNVINTNWCLMVDVRCRVLVCRRRGAARIEALWDNFVPCILYLLY